MNHLDFMFGLPAVRPRDTVRLRPVWSYLNTESRRPPPSHLSHHDLRNTTEATNKLQMEIKSAKIHVTMTNPS